MAESEIYKHKNATEGFNGIISNGRCVFILGFSNIENIDYYFTICQAIQNNFKVNFNIAITGVTSQIVGSLFDLNKAYSEAKQVAEYKKFIDTPGLFYLPKKNNFNNKEKRILLFKDDLQYEIVELIYQNNIVEINRLISQAFQNAGSVSHETKGYFLGAVLELMIGVTRALEQKGMSFENVFDAEIFSYEFLDGFENIEKLTEWLSTYFSLIASAYSIHEDTDINQLIIENIKRYVKDNLEKEISLSKIAEYFHYNNNYISMLFKKKESILLSTYINSERIKKAKALLQQNVKSIDEIALKCGFKDSNYFIKVFKSYTGTTPTKYRRITY